MRTIRGAYDNQGRVLKSFRTRQLAAISGLVACIWSVAACGSSGASQTQYRTPTDLSQKATIVVHANQTSVPVMIKIRKGNIAFIRVISDTPGRVGVAGYGAVSRVSPQKPAILAFSADSAGTFPIVARFGSAEREVGVASIK